MNCTTDSGAARPLTDQVAIRVADVSKRYHSIDGGPTRNQALNDLILLLRQIIGLRTGDGALEALKNLSFEVPRGTALGIIGGNGSGKSTLLKLISRVTPLSSGQIEVNGRIVSLIEMGFGFRDDWSGRDNVLMSGAAYGIPKAATRERLEEIVAFAELAKFIDMPLRSYSSGMYLRLAFSTAIHMAPDIILADEVLAVGDMRFRKRCLDRLMELKAAGKTLLYVSHNLSEIRRVADQVLWLHEGSVAGYGETNEIVDAYIASLNDTEPQPLPLVTWDGDAKDTPPVTIESACLTSGKSKQVQVIESHRPCYVQLRIRTLEPNLRIFPRIDIGSATEPVGRLAPLDPEPVPVPTTIDATLRLPRHLLNTGRYTAKVSVEVLRDDRRHLVVVNEPIAFSVVAPHEAGQPYLLNERAPGGVHPLYLNARCSWEFSGRSTVLADNDDEAHRSGEPIHPDEQQSQKTAGKAKR